MKKLGRTAVLRWIVVPLYAIAGYYLTVVLVAAALIVLNRWCPGGVRLAGMCLDDRSTRFAPYLGAVAGPLLVMVPATLAAPTRRGAVAWSLYGLGVLYGGFLYIGYRDASLGGPVLAGLAVGAGAAWLLQRGFVPRRRRKR